MISDTGGLGNDETKHRKVKGTVSAEKVYDALTEKSDILNDYIIPEYEILHTQGKEYIVDDIIEVMKERGVL